jgi:hypothetical protein
VNPRDYALAKSVRTAFGSMGEAVAAAEALSAHLGVECAIWFAEGVPARRLSDVQVPDRYIVGTWQERFHDSPPGGSELMRRINARSETQNNQSPGRRFQAAVNNNNGNVKR